MHAETVFVESAVQRFPLDPETEYAVDLAAHLAGMSRHTVLVCCKLGWVHARVDPDRGSYSFDAEAVRTLQRIEYLRTECGVNAAGIRIILDLWAELDRRRPGGRN